LKLSMICVTTVAVPELPIAKYTNGISTKD
jgi:hypothetical protein